MNLDCIHLAGLGPKQPELWGTMYPRAHPLALNLLNKMLIFNPRKRITVEDALAHPYLSKYHDTDDEPICIPAFNFDFEKQVRKALSFWTMLKDTLEQFLPRMELMLGYCPRDQINYLYAFSQRNTIFEN